MKQNNEVNGWQLYTHWVFKKLWNELKQNVIALKIKNPNGYHKHPKAKLLASIYDSIAIRVPQNPGAKEFRLGNTLGKSYRAWRRIKNGLPQRYRLFFRFSTKPVKIVVYVWFNDDSSLRKSFAKSDVYAVFKHKLERGEVPNSVNELINESTIDKTIIIL